MQNPPAWIGRGDSARCTRFSSLDSGEEFAVKSVDRALPSEPLDRDLALRVAKFHQLASAGNTHAVQIHAAYEAADSVHLVVDLCPGADLFSCIFGRAPLPKREASAVIIPLMEAMAACRRWGIAHRDVKRGSHSRSAPFVFHPPPPPKLRWWPEWPCAKMEWPGVMLRWCTRSRVYFPHF